jgi:predicted O-methyltransferase YrrM
LDVDNVGFLHIDGNHASDEALKDVEYWGARMAPGGIIVMDDCDWPSTRVAVDYLDSRYKFLEEIVSTNIVRIYET